MDTGAIFERIEQSCKILKIDLSFGEIASFADDNTLSQEQLDAIAGLFSHLADKKHQAENALQQKALNIDIVRLPQDIAGRRAPDKHENRKQDETDHYRIQQKRDLMRQMCDFLVKKAKQADHCHND